MLNNEETMSPFINSDAKKRKKSVQKFRAEDQNKNEVTSDDSETEETGEEQAEEEEETVTSSSSALVGDGDVDGGQVYSFRTPKRSNRAAQMELEASRKTQSQEQMLILLEKSEVEL
ncbi:hypothetical protein BSL78_26505 [Apostichopus japonicus]|uniref:Uncharacterized protein n=1 Tax=Stichopus japonicus TaxID=307972 RepID=A0A2G8JLR8_STIJA|nr:hypothetical protein BSL78_26505 [Apostichopus japonicus]